MVSIALSPTPGLYAQASQTVSMTASGYSTILVSTVSQPVFAKNVAYDTFGNPFISVVQDGKGNVLFDGGFPKYYNAAWTGASTFAELDNRLKLLYNAVNWLATGNAINTPNSVLIYGDQQSAGSYAVKGIDGTDFNTTLTNVSSLAGFTTTFIDTSDYSSADTIPYSLLAQHSSIIIMSSLVTADGSAALGSLSAASLTNIQTFRQNGGGVMVITDHNIFQSTANQVANLFGASFSGNINRSPVNVDYLVATYGNHPLWANMTGDVYAGASEGIITVPIPTPFDPATQTIAVTGPGYKNVYVTVSDTAGVITTQIYSYALQVADPVSYTTGLPSSTVYKYVDFPYEVDRMNSTDTSGFALVNGIAIGEFLRTSSGSTQKTYFNSTYKPILVNMGENNTVTVSVSYPVAYAKNTTITAAAVNTTSVIPAKRWASMQQFETAGVKSKAKLLSMFRANQNLSFTPVLAKSLTLLNKYYGSTATTPTERIITAGASGTIGYGYERRSNVAGGTYGSINSTANMFGDLSLNHFANYVDDADTITSVSFVKQSGAAQQPSDFFGKRFRVLDANDNVVFDKPFTQITFWHDYGGVDGFVMFFSSTKYIFASGGTWKLQVV